MRFCFELYSKSYACSANVKKRKDNYLKQLLADNTITVEQLNKFIEFNRSQIAKESAPCESMCDSMQ